MGERKLERGPDSLEGFVVVKPDRLIALLREAFPQLASMEQARDEYLTIEKVAEILDVDPRTVRTYINREGLPAIQLPGGLRFDRAALVEWLNGRAVKPGSHVDRNVTKLNRAKGK